MRILNFLSLLISSLSMYFAYRALSVWKEQKKYEVYQETYKFLISLKDEITYVKEIYKELGNLEYVDIETKINEEMGQYLKRNLGSIKVLELELQQINDKGEIVPYLVKFFNIYSKKVSDIPGCCKQRVCNYETGEEWDIDPYNKSFYEEYFLTDDNDEKKELRKTLNLKIEEGIKEYTNKIQKYFKRYGIWTN